MTIKWFIVTGVLTALLIAIILCPKGNSLDHSLSDIGKVSDSEARHEVQSRLQSE